MIFFIVILHILLIKNFTVKKGDKHNSFNHQALAELLRKRQEWVLYYNDCVEVRELYKGHKILNPEWTYGMENNKKSNELVILSKDL